MGFRRGQAAHDRRIRLIIWIVMICLGILVFFCVHPLTFKNEAHVTPGVPITLESVSDFLIVVDYKTFKSSPGNFGEMSFSLAWLNTFQQEIGPVSHLDAAAFLDADLSKFRCIILTRSVAEQGAWIPKIRGYLERGGMVVMEMPGDQLRQIASADGKGGIRTTQNITYASGLEPQWLSPLSSLNLTNLTELVGSAGPLDDSQTYFTIDGVPVIYSKKYALGRIITVDFDYGMLLTSLQQGRPLDNFTIRNMRDSTQIETSDLGQSESTMTPLADILERYLIYGVIGDNMPVVGFWPFFDGMDGALILSERENNTGDASIWMAQYESTFKASSSLFATSPLRLSDDALDDLHQTRCELGLMFDLDVGDDSLAREPMGMFKISPVWYLYNIEEQAAALKDRLDEHSPLLSAQSRNGLWGTHYTRTFQMLVAAGFRADASYRASLMEPGYAFATGLPFMPLDTNGLAFNIQEFPVAFPDFVTEEHEDQLKTMLQQSQESLHEAIGVSINTDFFVKDPNVEQFLRWQAIYQMASSYKHWVTSILNYFRFTRARFNAELKSRLVELQINRKPVQVLRLETLAPENGMTVTVPRNLNGKSFSEARRGLQRVREDIVLGDVIQTQSVSVIGYERVIVPLSKGFNAIDILYE